jgi:hypothetical protein
MVELESRPEKFVPKIKVWFWIVYSIKYDAEKLPLLYVYIDVLTVRREELGVTRKLSHEMVD